VELDVEVLVPKVNDVEVYVEVEVEVELP